jgi:hypothetical protein
MQEVGDFCGRMVVQELLRDPCSVEYTSAFHRKDLSPRIKVIFILYGVAQELVSQVSPNRTKFLFAVGVHFSGLRVQPGYFPVM